MKFTNALLMTAAVAVLSTAAIAADGSKNTDGTHNANNTQTDTNMGDAHPSISNDAAADVNANASTEAEMSDTSNDVDTRSDINATPDTAAIRSDTKRSGMASGSLCWTGQKHGYPSSPRAITRSTLGHSFGHHSVHVSCG